MLRPDDSAVPRHVVVLNGDAGEEIGLLIVGNRRERGVRQRHSEDWRIVHGSDRQVHGVDVNVTPLRRQPPLPPLLPQTLPHRASQHVVVPPGVQRHGPDDEVQNYSE